MPGGFQLPRVIQQITVQGKGFRFLGVGRFQEFRKQVHEYYPPEGPTKRNKPPKKSSRKRSGRGR